MKKINESSKHLLGTTKIIVIPYFLNRYYKQNIIAIIKAILYKDNAGSSYNSINPQKDMTLS